MMPPAVRRTRGALKERPEAASPPVAEEPAGDTRLAEHAALLPLMHFHAGEDAGERDNASDEPDRTTGDSERGSTDASETGGGGDGELGGALPRVLAGPQAALAPQPVCQRDVLDDELPVLDEEAGMPPRDTRVVQHEVHVSAPADDPTDQRVVSHYSSIALPGNGAGQGDRRSLPLVETR